MKSSAEKDPPRKKSAERLGELRSRYMEIAVKLPISPDLGVQRSILSCQRFSFQCFSFIQSPISPPSNLRHLLCYLLRRGFLLRQGFGGQDGGQNNRQAGPTQWLFQEPPAESKFLAAQAVEDGATHNV
jgi:hypothetical protein